ncbi:arginase [Lactobacillus selangorensis]|uniref:Arginase n=1 Tax=Lactobacillus selangorensis TaxID=81857 RepID=A0A0R2G018_9LACO|nr:arginase family protein [Lactobacillus selangorensis]KRN28091.1 arginase [Lactobacillus selangorensis]KRN31031.1 arginase [Lactobacillus selangorensis]
MSETIRLEIPQWQGGMNPNYVMGAKILAALVPDGNAETIKVPVDMGFERQSETERIDGKGTLLAQMETTRSILATEKPDKVITLGGDCSVSEAPFEYLHNQYGEHFGVIWLDAHPDISNEQQSQHLHEMVLANLLGKGARDFNSQNPLQPSHVMLAGLEYEQLRPMDQAVKDLAIDYATPQQLAKTNQPILTWIKANQIEQVAIHWDLDVLSPADFRSILPARPYLDSAQFGAAIGEMTLKQVTYLLRAVSEAADLVGLTLAEPMPWDAIHLNHALAQLPIFRD